MSVELNKEMFIFGEPIETEVGLIRFLTYREYLLNMQSISMISMNTLHIYYQYRKMFEGETDGQITSALEELKRESLFNIIGRNDNFKNAYRTIFSLVLDKNHIDSISDKVELILADEKMFNMMRELVMSMQMINEEDVSSNPEIQRGIERSRRVKQKEAEKQTFSDIISSVVVGASIPYREIVNMTVLQLYSTYYRLGAMYNYQTSTLFATVADKVQIESWGKHIDLFQNEKDVMDRTTFDKQFGGGF